ncbi:MAG: phosphate ABC transporter permease subunit PstC [Acidobacteriota bacterium]
MSRSRSDFLLIWCLRGTAVIASAIVALIFVFVFMEALPALLNLGPVRFFADDSWHPTEKLYNLAPMLSGTLLVMLGSVVIATPLGILSALFCNYYAPAPLAHSYRRLVELLAGIPSVVYGFWGLVVLVPLIARLEPPGASLLAGIAILSLMILPTVSLLADSSLAGVPREYLQGAAALGLTRWTTVRCVALPAAKSGLWTGIFLSVARALGETMAVLMVCGNVVQTPSSLFDPIRTLTANIALEMAYAMGDHRSALFVSGLVLMLMIVGLVASAEIVSEGSVHA